MKPEPASSEPEEANPEIEPEPEPAPEPEGPEAPVELPVQEDDRALTLADLACTLLSIPVSYTHLCPKKGEAHMV